MDEIHRADAGDLLYEVWHEDGQWTWKVSEQMTKACLGLHREATAELAKNQILIQFGQPPDGEWRITKIGARAIVDDTRLAVIWNADHWEWEVSHFRRNERLGAGRADSLEDGKEAATRCAGFAPERVDWQPIG